MKPVRVACSDEDLIIPDKKRSKKSLRQSPENGQAALIFIPRGTPQPLTAEERKIPRLPNPWPPAEITALIKCVCIAAPAGKLVIELIKAWIDDRKGRRFKIKYGDYELEVQGGMSEKKIDAVFVKLASLKSHCQKPRNGFTLSADTPPPSRFRS